MLRKSSGQNSIGSPYMDNFEKLQDPIKIIAGKLSLKDLLNYGATSKANRDALKETVNHGLNEIFRRLLADPEVSAFRVGKVAEQRNAEDETLREVLAHPAITEPTRVSWLAVDNTLISLLAVDNVAKHRNATDETLRAVLDHRQARDMAFKSVAKNPNAKDETLREVLAHPKVNYKSVAAVAKNPNAKDETLREVLAHSEVSVRSVAAVAENPNAKDETLRKVLAHPKITGSIFLSRSAVEAVAKHPNATDETLRQILAHKNVLEVLTNSVKNKNVTTETAEIVKPFLENPFSHLSLKSKVGRFLSLRAAELGVTGNSAKRINEEYSYKEIKYAYPVDAASSQGRRWKSAFRCSQPDKHGIKKIFTTVSGSATAISPQEPSTSRGPQQNPASAPSRIFDRSR